MTMTMIKSRVSLSLCAALLLVAAAGCNKTDTAPAPGTTGTTGTTVRVTDGVARPGDRRPDKAISDSAGTFGPRDDLPRSTDGSAPSATLQVKWTFEDSQTVDESRARCAERPRADEFHISESRTAGRPGNTRWKCS